MSVCEHGSLQRCCEICELKAELAEREGMTATRGLEGITCPQCGDATVQLDYFVTQDMYMLVCTGARCEYAIEGDTFGHIAKTYTEDEDNADRAHHT